MPNGDVFSVCFNMQKIKYADFDKTFNQTLFLNPDDKVNVFINLESILRNISKTRDLEMKVFDCADFTTIMVSNIINLAAHYRRFFRGNGLDTRVYLYYTDITSDEFNESEINDDYRSYYSTKYSRNPKFSMMGNKFKDEVITMTKQITDFIGGVYTIEAHGVEGSLVPMIIANEDPKRKNVIITSDIVETQYTESGSYATYFLSRNADKLNVYYTMDGYLKYIVARSGEPDFTEELTYYQNKQMYILLLSCIGEKYRSVEGVSNLKNGNLIKLIKKGLAEQRITEGTKSFDILKEIFPEILQEHIEENYKCLNLEEMYKRLTNEQIFSITSQLVDRFDTNSLLKLNSTMFFKHQLMLEELTM